MAPPRLISEWPRGSFPRAHGSPERVWYRPHGGEAAVGPLAIDLVVFAFTIGPLILSLNVLTLVGIAIVAFIVRSWI